MSLWRSADLGLEEACFLSLFLLFIPFSKVLNHLKFTAVCRGGHMGFTKEGMGMAISHVSSKLAPLDDLCRIWL